MSVLKTFIAAGFLAMIFLSACKSGLNERQKLFLDYAKLEDKYHATGFYRNLDLYDANTDPAIYKDSAFNISSFKAELQKSFKLVLNGNQIQTDLGTADLQYPHRYIFTPQKDGSIHVSLSVFVPDTYYKFSLNKNDIGKAILKDSAEITLLDMTNDGVTLMVENKGRRQSYDYTYDSFDRKDFSEKKRVEEYKQPGYDNYLFISESVETPNSSQTTVKDSLMELDFGRLNISLADEKGKTLVSDGRINDFRHYLWYRNHDMPYTEMASDYNDLRLRYKEEDQDSLHKFHPIHILNLKASGKVGQVDFFLRSNKGHVETIDLGNKIPQQAIAQVQEVQHEFLPLVNITKENVAKLLKINCVTLPVKQNEADYVMLYSSVPHGYNNGNMNIDFDDIQLVGDKKDTIDIDQIDNARDYFNVGYSNRNYNLNAVKFPMKNQSATKVIGKINLSVNNYYDKEFNINQLPKGLSMAADGVTLNIKRGEPLLENMVEFYAFEKGNKLHPLATFRIDDYSPENEGILAKYVKKPATVIIRFKQNEGQFNQEIPFELDIPKIKDQK
ncbi:hypothetical protein [Pedobacter punctiformis]|uniref:Lipoprotein n=1 Tax=Pedobacter punctiformis TaxID=3004097 RepID=A0ABT4L3M4_9SPHI|nr:hypothetical protein [Pedobacter sp. HCMS5-2]MCZ4242530.1 hypothetical protein [Pedobacter sp. HCMS5-2]